MFQLNPSPQTRRTTRRFALPAIALLALAACGTTDEPVDPCSGVAGTCLGFEAGATHAELQAALIGAAPGSTIALGAGRFELDATLSLAVDNVTIRGAGMDATILAFANQAPGGGGEGIRVDEVAGFMIEDLTVQDSRGDGIKVVGSSNVVFRRVRVEWTREAGKSATTNNPCNGIVREDNGAYAIYPVQSRNVLVEDSEAIGASDAGIYVGQSQDIIVRNSLAECNVAGIEIENSWRADVYGNTARHNTGGFLVFDLPGLQQKDGNTVRVFNNRFVSNNTNNFAPAGNIVGEVPRGTGVIVMANHDVELFDNEIADHDTTAVAVVSYLITERAYDDPGYNPYPSRVHIHGNSIADAGGRPDIGSTLGLALVALFPDGDLPALIYDGIVTNAVDGAPAENPMHICFRDNGDVGFANINADQIDTASPDPEVVDRNPAPYNCSLPALTAVDLGALTGP